VGAAFRRYAADFVAGPYLRGRLARLERRLESGQDLAKALAEDGDLFPAWLPGLVAAGVSSGRLERAVDMAGRLLAAEARVAQAVRTGLVYPCMLAGLCALYFAWDMRVVLPMVGVLRGASGAWDVLALVLSAMLVVPWVLLLLVVWPGRIARERRLRALLHVLPGGRAVLADLEHAAVAAALVGVGNQPLTDAVRAAARVATSGGLKSELEAAAAQLACGARPADALVSEHRRRGPFLFQVVSALADRDTAARLDELAARHADRAAAGGAALASRLDPMMIVLLGFVVLALAIGQAGMLESLLEAVQRELRRA
jgi:type II secretory pathway component PulF